MLLWVGHYENEHFSFALNILFRFSIINIIVRLLKHHCILNIISFTLLRNGPMYYVFKWRIPFFCCPPSFSKWYFWITTSCIGKMKFYFYLFDLSTKPKHVLNNHYTFLEHNTQFTSLHNGIHKMKIYIGN